MNSNLNYWKEKLSGDLPVLSMPTNYPRPAIQSFSGNEIRQSADEGFKFTPDYSFFYLTGIKQASTILLMTKNSILSDEYLFIQK